MSTAVLQRQVPWVPGPDDPPQAAATSGDPGSGESFTVPAAYLFRHECHYNVFDIAEIANLPLKVVQGAAARKEISLVCTESSRGKSWPGHAIAGWIERSGHKCSVPEMSTSNGGPIPKPKLRPPNATASGPKRKGRIGSGRFDFTAKWSSGPRSSATF